MKQLFLFLLFLQLITNACFSQNNIEKKVNPPDGYTSIIDAVYTRVGDWEGKMDLYVDLHSKQKLPVLLNIHGGGWNHGNKESQNGFNIFFKEKFAVANVEYRLVQTAYAPGAIEDIRSAIEYLKVNHLKFNLDPDNIILMGASAGGHLALMGGLLGNDRRFDKYCKNNSTDMKIKAVIDKYGPVDFTKKDDKFYNYKSLIWWMGEKSDSSDFRRLISPITYISDKSPHILIIHGTDDPIVPYSQSVLLHNQLETNGIYNEFITIDGGLHGKFDKSDNERINDSTIEFLKKIEVIE